MAYHETMIANGNVTAKLPTTITTIPTTTTTTTVRQATTTNPLTPYFHTTTTPRWEYLLLYIIPFGTIWGNIFVCLAVYIERRLRHRFNLFLVSLAISDLLCALLVMPVSAWHMIMGQTNSDLALCLIWYSLDIFFTATTIIHMCNISLDRYLALRQPFGSVRTQPPHHPLNTLSARIIFSWLIPFSIAGPLFLYALMRQDKESMEYESLLTTTTMMMNYQGYSLDDNQSVFTTTTDDVTMSLEDQFHATESSYKGCGPNHPSFALTAILITFILPLIIMIVTYILTVHTLRKHMKQIQAVQLYTVTKKQCRDTNRRLTLTSLPTLSTPTLSSSTSPTPLLTTPTTTTTTTTKLLTTIVNQNVASSDMTAVTTTTTTTTITCTGMNVTVTKNTLQAKYYKPWPIKQWKSLKSNHHSCQLWQKPMETTTFSASNTIILTDEPSIMTTSTHSYNENTLNVKKPTKDSLHEETSVSTGISSVQSNKMKSSKIINHYTTIRQSSTTSTNPSMMSIDRIHSAKRAVRVIGVLFAIFLICYLPFFIVYFIDVLCTACSKQCTGKAMAHLEWLGYLSSMLNPFVYHAFNPTFRRTYRRMLRCACFCPHRQRHAYYANWRRKIKI
ncbi:unnamed protein product [Schistosoma turkestanicum]|nr:unnamed protein product [Schistosoma turkestanicum]